MGYQPWGNFTIRRQLICRMVKPHIAGLLVFMHHKKRPGHGRQGILAIGNQLMGQKRECAMAAAAQKPGDRNLSFSEGKKIYCEPVILLDPPIAPFLTANGTFEAYNPGKMDASLNKGFFVFPDIGVCVIK